MHVKWIAGLVIYRLVQKKRSGGRTRDHWTIIDTEFGTAAGILCFDTAFDCDLAACFVRIEWAVSFYGIKFSGGFPVNDDAFCANPAQINASAYCIEIDVSGFIQIDGEVYRILGNIIAVIVFTGIEARRDQNKY